MVEVSWIHPKLCPYAQNAYKTMTAPVSTINEIFAGYNYGMRVLTKEEDMLKSYDAFCATYDEDVTFVEYAKRFYHRVISIDNPTMFHPTILASSMLGIHLINWKWDDSGTSVIIEYTDKK